MRIPTASARLIAPPSPERAGSVGDGSEFSPRSRRPTSSASLIADSVHHDFISVQTNAMGPIQMHRSSTVNVRKDTVNILRKSVSEAVKGEPAKVIALKLGVSHRQVENWRTGLLLPQVPQFLEIAKRDPALRAQVFAILSGDGEMGSPENINAIMRFMQGRGGG